MSGSARGVSGPAQKGRGLARPAGDRWPGAVLDRSFLVRPSVEVAPALLNKVLVAADGRAGRIVEVEAYAGTADPASHAFRGRTPRNGTMFGPAGHLYVYFSYGVHWCANVVTGPEGEASAVLLRALEPLAGLEAMRAARWRAQKRQVDRDLCRGPGRLCQAMGIDRSFDGVDLCGPPATDHVAGHAPTDDATGGSGRLWLVDDGTPPPVAGSTLAVSPRIGISAARDVEWRFALAGHPGVSASR